MKMKLVKILILMSINFIAFTATHGQTNELISAKIEWVNLDIETFADVNCDNFRSTFEGMIKTTSITNSSSMHQVSALIKKFKPGKVAKINVRGIITFNYRNKAIEYCFDQFGFFNKDGIVCQNKKLFNLMVKSVNSEAFKPN